MIKKLFKSVAVGLIATMAVGCGLTGSSEDERYLQVELTQRDSLDQVINTMGDYEVPITKRQISLDNALKKEISLQGYRGAKVWGRENGNPDKDIIVFVVSFDAQMDGEHFYGGVHSVPVVDKPVDAEPTGQDIEAMHEGTYYGFFVEGIGDLPDVPVQVVLRGSSETEKLTIDPKRHTLARDYALHVDESEVPLIHTDGPSSVEAEYSPGNEVTEDDRFINVFHLPQGNIGPGVGGGILFPGTRHGIQHNGHLEGFNYYLLSVK